MKTIYFAVSFSLLSPAFSQTITIVADAQQKGKSISPLLYGRNNNASDDPSNPVSAAAWKKYNDAGLRIYRENGGNDCTKYNWRLKLSSHPDWYNNVYAHDWDYCASSVLSNAPGAQFLSAFQLIGKAASNKNNNFNDWGYNSSQWWSGVCQNLAGGGTPNNSGGCAAQTEGNPNLYLENWSQDSTVGILYQWFKKLNLDSNRLRYWNMDNEPEAWESTHDDVVKPGTVTAEDFMQKFFAVAKAARKKFPGIKLVGPVSTNEWQWYAWHNAKVHDPSDGKDYVWMEYFIKRIGEEQKASGVRLLDVLDVHFYPGTENNPDLQLQLHRVWFDTLWNYSGANGVKLSGPTGWDNSITKEYFFQRCQKWLDKYLGVNNGVTLSVSECGAIANNGSDPNVVACWYASNLGVFADHGVEIFTPWDWYIGQWEVLHMFSNYYGKTSVKTTSSLDTLASGYSSLSANGDSLVIVVVNRDRNNARNIDIGIQNFLPSVMTVNGYQLANLGSAETFVSHSSNALASKQFTLNSAHIAFSAPKLSVTLIQVPGSATGVNSISENPGRLEVFPNPASGMVHIKTGSSGDFSARIIDVSGRTIREKVISGNSSMDVTGIASGIYVLQIFGRNGAAVQNELLQIKAD